MPYSLRKISTSLFLMVALAVAVSADRRNTIYNLGLELGNIATALAQNSYDQFKGRNGAISDREQAVLFKSEAFAANCRLFAKLAQERSGYYRSDHLRTNLYSAFAFLDRSFQELDREMRSAGVRPYALRDCERLLDRMEREFSQWPAVDNLAYLHQKYVKARDATVYMIERLRSGVFVRRAFKDLESIYRYNYEMQRGKDPWEHLVEVPYETLESLEAGPMVELTFEGSMIMDQTERPNRPVYLVENGKLRGITSANLVRRYGGWDYVFEVPLEVLQKYPRGEPIK